MNPYQHAASAMPHLMGKHPSGVRILPGLPASRFPGVKGIGFDAANLGATQTQLGGSPPPDIAVGGQPSMKLRILSGKRGAATSLQRYTKYAAYILDSDLLPLNRTIDRVVRQAEAWSQGPLSTAELRRRNHPYGRGAFAPSGGRRGGLGRLQGRTRGLSNLSIVNRQSGEFARSWGGLVTLTPTGVDLELINTAPYAGYLAGGTTRMKAHGPFTAAMVRHLPEINSEWLRVTRSAYMRKQLADQAAEAASFYRFGDENAWYG